MMAWKLASHGSKFSLTSCLSSLICNPLSAKIPCRDYSSRNHFRWSLSCLSKNQTAGSFSENQANSTFDSFSPSVSAYNDYGYHGMKFSNSNAPSDYSTRKRFLTTMEASKRHILRGVVFDMDGTLTVPCIDFGEMRRRIGAKGRDILEEIDGWSEERRAEAYRIISSIELEANSNMKVMPGAVEICQMLDAQQIRRGLITRNVKSSVDHFHSQFGIPTFQPALSREFRPYKPDPGPLIHICQIWGVQPDEVIIIGDSAKDDIVCGNRAGAMTCLLDEDNRYDLEDLSEEEKPTFKIKALTELETILKERFELRPIGQ